MCNLRVNAHISFHGVKCIICVRMAVGCERLRPQAARICIIASCRAGALAALSPPCRWSGGLASKTAFLAVIIRTFSSFCIVVMALKWFWRVCEDFLLCITGFEWICFVLNLFGPTATISVFTFKQFLHLPCRFSRGGLSDLCVLLLIELRVGNNCFQ